VPEALQLKMPPTAATTIIIQINKKKYINIYVQCRDKPHMYKVILAYVVSSSNCVTTPSFY